jgi:hypothetical protein
MCVRALFYPSLNHQLWNPQNTGGPPPVIPFSAKNLYGIYICTYIPNTHAHTHTHTPSGCATCRRRCGAVRSKTDGLAAATVAVATMAAAATTAVLIPLAVRADTATVAWNARLCQPPASASVAAAVASHASADRARFTHPDIATPPHKQQ